MLALFALACVKDRPVEAPVIDVGRGAPAREGLADGKPLSISAGFAQSGLVGRWEGIGAQDDGLTWPFSVEILSVQSGSCGAATYPTLRCQGEWECTGFKDGVLVADEHLLDDGATRCIDDGSMTMRMRTDGTLDWRWTGQGQNASSTMRRVR